MQYMHHDAMLVHPRIIIFILIVPTNRSSTYTWSVKSKVRKHVKDVFDDLSDGTLLRSCFHGKTVNANDTFNRTIWDIIPKTRFVKYKQCQMAVHKEARMALIF